MLRVLLAKDLLRARRNPLPWLVNLLVPLCITALIGLTFGGRSDRDSLGRIRFAVVDEDDSALTGFLRGAANQGEGAKYLDPVFLNREAAMRDITNDKISAVLVIPTNFTRHYLTGSDVVRLELIKNPAQSIHPTVIEELLGVVVTGLNAVARNFREEFPALQRIVAGDADHRQVAALIERTGDKLNAVREYIHPPLVSYGTEVRDGGKKSGPVFNLFAYLLAGLTAMFLLFIASNGMADLGRELRQRTFERYHTLHQRLLPFVAGKVVFTIVLLLLSSAVMLGGGAIVFRIQWQHPLALVALTLGYAGFAAGLMAVLAAAIPDERRAGVINTIVGMSLGLAGGCAFPPQQLPGFVRDHISPLLPSYWFAETVRGLESGGAATPWHFVVFKLVVLGAVLMVMTAYLFHRRFKSGLRA